jgi:hypothetical protein
MLRKIEKPIERNLRPKWDELGFVCSSIRDAGIIFTGYGLGQERLINNLMDQDISCVVTYDLLDDSNINYVGFDNFNSPMKWGVWRQRFSWMLLIRKSGFQYNIVWTPT